MAALVSGVIHYSALVFIFSSVITGQETDSDFFPFDYGSEAGREPMRQKAMSGDYYNTFHSLHLQILRSYNHHLRPEIGAGWPTICNFSMVVTHLDRVDEDAQTIDLRGWIILQWYDYRLAWNESTEYQEIEKLLMQQKVIWRPDIHLYNNAQSELDTMISETTQAQIFSDGRVVIDPTFSLRPYCQFNYKLFPWETHKCAVFLGSWAYRTHELKFQLRSITPEAVPVVYGYTQRVAPTNWRIVKDISQLADVQFDNESWHYVNITFYFERTPTFAANFVLLPAVVTALLTGVAFLSTAGRGDWKLAILLLALTLEVIHFVAIHAVLPKGVINGGPLIVTLCKANVFLTLIAFIIALVTKCISDRNSEPPAWLSRLLRNKILAQICCFPDDSSERGTRYSLRAEQNRRQGQRHPILEANKLIPIKRTQAQYLADDQDKGATSSRMDDSQNRLEDGDSRAYGSRFHGSWWRLGVMVDRILFVVLAIIYAVLWACYVGF